MQEETTTFFDFLSWRIYKENNLSDITWALCKANRKFRHLFLNYCFNEETPEMQVFEREIPSNDSRPDFYCEDMEKNVWILEVKIDDRKNLHFEQYRKEYKDAKIAFIANYDASSLCKKELNISIKTWKTFIDYLLKNIEDELIIGYSKYLKNLMGYLEVNEMDLNKVKSLPDFNTVLENIVHEYSEKKLDFYNLTKSMFPEKFGRHICFKNNNGKIIYFWIGIYFCDDKNKTPYFCLEFNIEDKNWVPKNEAEIIKNLKDGKYLYAPDIYDGVAHFYLKDDIYDILFSEKPEIEKQKEIIINSLNEIFTYI
jgi:hypothetical protein